MRWQYSVIPLLAVTTAASAAPPPKAAVPSAAAPPALVDKAGAATQPWVRLRRGARPRWTAAGKAIAPDGSADVRGSIAAQVVAETENTVRLRLDTDDVHLLVWVDRAALHHVLVRDTPLAVPTAPKAKVTLRAGAPVDIESRDGATARVRLMRSSLDITGDVAVDAVGTTYPDAADERPDFTGKTIAILEGGFSLRAAPSTTAPLIATTRHMVSVEVLGEVKGDGGWRDVQIDDGVVRARGFAVPSSYLLGGFVDDGKGSSAPDALPVGTCLYDRPGGAIVGAVVRPVQLAAGSGSPGWQLRTVELGQQRFPVATRDGEAPRCKAK